MKILIAEDDTVSRLLLEATLKKQGHEVVAAENGRVAWKAFQKEYFPILITDWMMPDMDGLALCRAIRSLHRDAYTGILLLTVLGGKTNYLEAMNAGADDFLTKPFDEEQLITRLQVAARLLGLRQHVITLEGLLPICASCKKICDEKQQWQPIESYIAQRSLARFSHGICPECSKQYMQMMVSP